jgi:hypothetical protein
MRKKGILVTIGIVLTLLVYIGIGVAYFYPQLAEQKRIESKEEPLPKAKVEEKVTPPVKVEVVAPEKELPKEVAPVEVKVEEPKVVAEEVTPPKPVVVEEVKEPPVVIEEEPPVVEEELPEVEVEIPVPVEVVAEEVVVEDKEEVVEVKEEVAEVKARVFERIQPTVEIDWIPRRAVPVSAYERLETALDTFPHFTQRVITEEVAEVEMPAPIEVVAEVKEELPEVEVVIPAPVEVKEEVVEVKARVFERIQPTVDLIPVERRAEPPLYRAEVIEPLFKAPQPVELFWDSPKVAEEARYLNLPTFLAEAHKMRQEAVDAIFDKLIWP